MHAFNIYPQIPGYHADTSRTKGVLAWLAVGWLAVGWMSIDVFMDNYCVGRKIPNGGSQTLIMGLPPSSLPV